MKKIIFNAVLTLLTVAIICFILTATSIKIINITTESGVMCHEQKKQNNFLLNGNDNNNIYK